MTDEIKQFGRVCHLVVGKNGSGINFKGLRISFQIKKTSDSKANEAKIEIYNPNPEHINLLLKEWQDIFLMAGYEGNEQMIFTGQIKRSIQKIEGLDRIVVIESGDGEKSLQNSVVNKTFVKGSNDDQVIHECQSSMQSPTGHKDDLESSPRARGKVVSGRVSNILDKVAVKHNAQWSIQDGQLLLLRDKNLRPNAVWLINTQTGMLGRPEVTDSGTVKVSTLLNPAYMIGGLAKIEALSYQGGIRIESIEHSGDTHSSDWSSKLEGQQV
ncbi:phage protein [Acinetobacter higginsii]|uniref:phage protein n=1 Tax=Acinetobacter higginsii TaxID=70347 RepID=UPI001F4BCB8A|nr:hypothetical protein [Acinetobacter higginsii]MCH7305632.1 hypothetical protein [Acinetobacter higginsii]MCI3877560.1 hypothetical protein [Acinetobacter higginsii]